MSIEQIAIIALALAVIIGCCAVIVYRLTNRHNKNKPLASIESQLPESLDDKALLMQAIPFESCLISAKDIEEAINICINPLRNLEASMDYTGKRDWAKPMGVMCDFSLSIKELLIFSMTIADPRSAIDLLASILEINVPADALEIMQKGKKPFPKYRSASLTLWLQMREKIDDILLAMKKTYGTQKQNDGSMLCDLVISIMKTLYIPIEASGLAIVFGLALAKIEFSFSFEMIISPIAKVGLRGMALT